VPIARSSSRLLAALLALTVALVALAGPASAQETPADPASPTVRSGGDDRIIGGIKAPPGEWPSQAAIFLTYREGSYSETYQVCGATVIDPMWVLTAAHCVSDGPRYVTPARDLSVRVGTQDLASGGRSIRVARVVVRPSYSPRGISNDVALLQLASATDVPRDLEVASPTDIPWSGANLTTAGWGQSDQPGDYSPNQLRQVDVPAMSGPECQTALNDARAEFGTPAYHSSHLCTGPLGSGGRGPCYGDSGGPLVWETGGRKILVGIVSWGAYCASPETPSVFSKVASASRWIADTIEYGPHYDAEDFGWAVRDAYFDYIFWEGPIVEVPEPPVPGEPGAFIAAYHSNPVVTKRDATIVRLYQAILGRPAENHGYQYWRERMLFGRYSATKVAEVMARSAEFKSTYGALDDESFVEQLYLNVLGRAGAPADVDYWEGRLTAGNTRGQVAGLIAESAENKARTKAAVDVQVAFMNLLYRAPAAYEIAQWETEPLADLGRFIIHSVAYARRYGGYWYEAY